MASSPGFDPNLIEKPDGYAKVQATKSPCPPEPAAPLLNRATQGLYPPGSTFKTITAAAALDDGVYTAELDLRRPGLLHRVRQARSPTRSTRAAPRPSASSTSSRPTSTRSTPSSATSARSSGRSGSSTRRGSSASTRCRRSRRPSDARSASGLYHNGKLFDPSSAEPVHAGRPGPARVRAGDDARDAAPDGDGRGGGREQGRPDEADADQEGHLARRLDRPAAATRTGCARRRSRRPRPSSGT